MRSKILLAFPSVLYAPLYLAKQLTLSKEFAHIDFEYPDHPNLKKKEQKRDELVYKLCHPHCDRSVIMAVVDPMRVVLEKGSDNYDQPQIIQTLINKMCYWAIAQYPNSATEILEKNYKIIVHPRGMTGHTIALYDLLNMLPGPIEEDKRRVISKILYHGIKPGEESRYFNNSHLLRINRARIGYVTTEPYDILNLAVQNDDRISDKKSFIKYADRGNNKVYCNAVMTSLITNHACLNNPLKKEILIDLIRGIKEAISLIYTTPDVAAKLLLEYDDTSHNISRNKVRFAPKLFGWNEKLMENLFESIIEEEKIYPSNLAIIDAELAKSKEFWIKRFEFESNGPSNEENLKLLQKLDSYVNKTWDH